MKYFSGKKGTKLIFILFVLLFLVIGFSIYFSIPISLKEGAVGSSTDSGSTGLSGPNTITNIKDVLNLPGVGNNVPTNTAENWAMVNEIVEPDGTVVQDIVNTDGTVLTITNKQNIINTGMDSGGNGSSVKGNSSGSNNAASTTFNRNVYNG